MDYLFFRSSGALAIRGAIAIGLGVVALLLPGPTFLALALAFGIFATVDGISALITVLDRRTRFNRGWLALEAIAGIFVGVFTALRPAIAALNLIIVIGAWAIVTGVLKIIAAVRLRKQIRHEWLFALSGVASIIFGVILLMAPLPGIIGLMWAVGIFGLVYGGMLVGLAIRMRRLDDTLPDVMPRAA